MFYVQLWVRFAYGMLPLRMISSTESDPNAPIATPHIRDEFPAGETRVGALTN